MSLPSIHRNFGGAISLAAWLKNNHVGLSTTICANISPGFVDCVSKYKDKPVKFFWRPELKEISIYLKTPTEYVILIPQAFNHCHRRFALCKELCHVLTDDPTVAAKNPSEQLKIAIDCSELVRNKKSILFANELASEDFCFLLAMEMMIPASHREKILERLTKGERAFDIAFGLRMPEALITYYRDSGYNQFYKLFIRANIASAKS
jgi:hypothetical protein